MGDGQVQRSWHNGRYLLAGLQLEGNNGPRNLTQKYCSLDWTHPCGGMRSLVLYGRFSQSPGPPLGIAFVLGINHMAPLATLQFCIGKTQNELGLRTRSMPICRLPWLAKLGV